MAIIHGASYEDEILPITITSSGLLLAGYDTIVPVVVSNLNAPAGTANLYSAVVPADEKWVVHNISASNNTRSGVRIVVTTQPVNTHVIDGVAVAPALTLFWEGILILNAGENLWGLYFTTVLNDDIYLRFRYRRILVPS